MAEIKFELNEYKRELSDDEILNDIKNVAETLGVDYISISTYKKYGKYSQTAIQHHFGTWKNAVSKVGLRSERNSKELKLISDEKYYRDLQRVAILINCDTVSYDAYKEYGKFSAEHIIHRFGKWNTALQKAGLKETGFSKDKITEQQCFDEIERIWILLGRQPTTTDIIKRGISIYSIDPFKKRFGGWRKALEAFVKYINSSDNLDSATNKEHNNPSVLNECIENVQTNDKEIINKKNIFNSVENKHKTSRNINTRLRFKVLQRDNFKCCACGASPAKDPSVVLHVDHIVPWAKGGETVIENLQTLCSKCNLGKSDML